MGLFLLFALVVTGIAAYFIWRANTPRAKTSQATSTAGQAASGPSGARWIPKGETTTIAGRSVTGGLYYVGRGVRAAGGYGRDPAVIDPSLQVNWQSPDWAGATMGYWPAYDQISPRCRAAYLSFLNSDRSTSDQSPRISNIGYVYLYFYGLERRAIIDLTLDGDSPAMAIIASELRRLLAAYEANRSFKWRASHLLELIESSSYVSSLSLSPPDPSTLEPTLECPLLIRVALGRCAANGQPIPSEWALSLLRTLLDANLRTPASRCRSEFDALFKLLYRQRYGDGMIVRPAKETITISYRPASSGFPGAISATLDGLPDVTGLERVRKPLREIGSACADQLDPYSRYLGRNPDARGSAQAAAFLPAKLLSTHGGPAVDRLREWTSASITSEQPVTLCVDDLVAQWSPGRTEKLSKAEAVSLAGTLAALGVGIEPDVRFGGATPSQGATIVAFRLAIDATAAPSPQYAAAAVLVHLCAVVAAADGTVTDDERQHLAEHIENVLVLDAAERQRLEAHLEWLVASKASLTGLKKRIDHIEVTQRAAMGSLLVDVAAADGVVTPDEITTLTNIYRLLGLEETDVYSAIHGLGANDGGPVAVRTAGDAEQRWDLPAPGTRPTGHITLDPERVQARLADTAAVTALLAGVFAEDSQDAGTSQSAPGEVPSTVSDDNGHILPGLDFAHSELARQLCCREGWSFAEAEGIAAHLGLPMFEGALERINECAFDVCAEPLVEGDDPLVVNDYAVKELLDAR